jgi:predicted SAM-dependent methyltransferase
LPFPDASQDTVFASHVLEHIEDWAASLVDWYRVLKIGGYMVIAVPHRDLYERK